MARVLLRTEAWGVVWDRFGNALPSLTFAIKNTDGSAATHWSAETGGTSSTATLTTDTLGGATLSGADRWIEAGEYDVTTNGTTYRVNTDGSPSSVVTAPPPSGGDDLAALQALTTAGVRLVLKSNATYLFSGPLVIPNFAQVEGGAGGGTICRASGNNYVFSFNPGNRSRISNLQVEAASAQSSGGGFDFTNAGSNIYVDHVYFGNNLFIGVNDAPAASANVHEFASLRWFGIASSGTGIILGDGTHLLSDVTLRDVKGTASTTSDMTLWLDVRQVVDTLVADDVLFIKGATGIQLGNNGAGGGGAVTGAKFSSVVLDTMTGIGIDFQNVKDFQEAGTSVQTCGSATLPGVRVGANVKGIRSVGGMIQVCQGEGMTINASATSNRWMGLQVSDNNQSNTASLNGVTIATGARFWNFVGCDFGNSMIQTGGNQAYGLSWGASCDDYTIIGCRFYRNATGAVNDGNITGANWTCGRAIVEANTALDAAGTTFVVIPARRSGDLYITDSAGTYHHRLVNSGQAQHYGQFDANAVLELRGTGTQSAAIAQFKQATTLKSEINHNGAFVSDSAADGIVLKDTQATPHYWRVTVGNTGVITTADLGTTRPD